MTGVPMVLFYVCTWTTDEIPTF